MRKKPTKAECEMHLARRARVVDKRLKLSLVDGRQLDIPLHLFPGLRLAPERAQKRVRVIYGGTGVGWPDLGHELGVGGLVRTCRKRGSGCRIT